MGDAAKIRILVCDDEPDTREGMGNLLERDPQVLLVGEARNGKEATAAIQTHSPDVVFLDVEMPMLDGFGVLAELADASAHQSPVIVFVTAYDAYALRAFEVHALDYLLKPFSDARFADALDRAKRRVRERRACVLGQQIASLLRPDGARPGPGDETDQGAPAPGAGWSAPRKYLEHFLVRIGGKVSLLRVGDVDWIEADDYCAKLHIGDRSYLIRETMQRLEAKLDPARFVRIHRSSIVHIDRLRTLEPFIKGSHILILRDGTRLTLSRGRRAAFEAAMGARV